MVRLKQEQAIENNQAKPRVFGAGTIVLTIGLIVIGGSRLFEQPKVTIERRLETSGSAHLERKPSVSRLLSWSEELALRDSQKALLSQLAQKEKSELAPVEARIAKVLESFDALVHGHQSGGAPLNEVQATAAPISVLGREKRQIEQSFADQAFAVLDAEQRSKAKQLLTIKFMRQGSNKEGHSQ